MSNLFWPIYKKLEMELLSITSHIRFDDNQLKVYSDGFLDILFRTSVEIEAIAKELYLNNGGTAITPENEMYFDTVCLDFLEKKWKLSERVVLISSINFYFEKEENKTITPLKKANKRGTSGSKWKQAYQAAKHNRSENFKVGNMKNCIDALAALYILNIYYKDETFKLGPREINGFDQTLGSDIFSILVNKGNSFNGVLKEDTSATYCINYTQDFIEKWKEKQAILNKITYDQIINDKKIANALDNGTILIQEIGDISKIQEIIGVDSVTEYIQNAAIKTNLNQFVAEREYCAYTNKL